MSWCLSLFCLWTFFSPCHFLLNLPPTCDNEIYCKTDEHGLLHVVQMARLYKDSKTFVDKSIKTSQEEVLKNFQSLMTESGNMPSKEQVQSFVDENFDPEGSEFEDWEPSDWNEDIEVLKHIKDERYREMIKDLHSRWQELGRKIKPDVQAHPEKYSLKYLAQPFIVPGGRFREMYYWDSFWTIQGLIVSEMYDTVHGMLANFVQLIKDLGHIPNGNRIYYDRRSQPPLFISMVDAYLDASEDEKFLQDNIQYLDQEFSFWMDQRTINVTVDGQTHRLAVYNVEVDDPRPESYYEDYHDAQRLPTTEEKQEFYQNMKSGAESGWDYSTRWFFHEDGTSSVNLTDIKTRHIIPVDLNAYLCKNARIMAKFHRLLGQEVHAQNYDIILSQFIDSIDDVLWNEEKGAWFDYNTKNRAQNVQFYPSNVSPLWAECYDQTKIRQKGMKEKISAVIDYMENHKAFKYPGGVPTSLVSSNQQWDFSNAWPPLQEIIVTGLENTGLPKGQQLALELVDKWVKNVYVSYVQSKQKMFEKYDVEQIGLPGGGGEYDVQEGFGWSNGVLMHFLSKYQDLISPDVETSSAPLSVTSTFVVVMLMTVGIMFI